MFFHWLLLSLVVTISQGANFCTNSDKCALGTEPDSTAATPVLARYDYTRIYNVDLATTLQVQIFQSLEAASDSCIFMGHAREPGQKLTILVGAQKVADFEDLLQSYNVSHRLLRINTIGHDSFV